MVLRTVLLILGFVALFSVAGIFHYNQFALRILLLSTRIPWVTKDTSVLNDRLEENISAKTAEMVLLYEQRIN